VSALPRLPDAIETLPEALAFWAERTPDAPALRSLDGRALSHRELARTAANVVSRLRALGIGPDDRVAFVLAPGFESCVAMLGGMTGATAVPLPPDATDHELARDLARLPVCLIVGPEAERVDEVAARLGIAAVGAGELCQPSPPRGLLRVDDVPVRPDSLAAILHTSGTTGAPKRAPRSHRALLRGARAASRRTGLTPDDVLLLTAGLHNISGLGNLLNALLSGGSCIAAPGLDPATFGRWLEKERPTWTFLTPTHLRLLTDAAEGREPIAGERSRLRLVRAGTQPLPRATRQRAEQMLGATILDNYGMSEAHSIAASGPGVEDRREGSPGRPLDISVRVLGDRDEELPIGGVGEIVVRGPTVMAGYLDDPEATAAAFTPDGWFRTGDVGYLDDDGFLFITGREKEQINRGGVQISPAEIDGILLEHPAVAEAAAFAVPDERLGEEVVAAVVAREGMDVTARELRRFLFDRLSLSRAPRRIWFVERLPRTATGKVQRAMLSRRFLAAGDIAATGYTGDLPGA
jgi:acyl-CoA synthetase (AMP-forming)/AMP-acid ligase II